MSRSRRLDYDNPFTNGDPCRVVGMVRGRSLHLNATYIGIERNVSEEPTYAVIVRINGQDPWTNKANGVISVPFDTVKHK